MKQNFTKEMLLIKKMGSASEEYLVKKTRVNFKCNDLGLIHITAILAFKLFDRFQQ